MLRYSSVKEVLKKELEEKNEFSANLKNEFLRNNWENVVGKTLALHSEPEVIKNFTLYVNVDNSTWIQQMSFYRNNLMNEANRLLNGAYIKNVVFKPYEKRKSEKKVLPEEEEKIITIEDLYLEGDEIYKIKKIISLLENEEIKRKFYNLITKSKKKEKALMISGFKKCQKCGIVFEGKEDICCLCRNEKTQETELKIYHALSIKPWILYKDLKFEIQEIDGDIFDRVKERFKSDLMEKIEIFKKEKKMEDLKKILIMYYMMEKSVDKPELVSKLAQAHIDGMFEPKNQDRGK